MQPATGLGKFGVTAQAIVDKHPDVAAEVGELVSLHREALGVGTGAPAPAPAVAAADAPTPGFVTLKSQPCLVPRGRFDIHFHEDALVFQNAKGVFYRVPRDTVEHVFAVSVKDKYKPKHQAVLYALVLSTPIMVGKQSKSLFVFEEKAIEKQAALPITREPVTAKLRGSDTDGVTAASLTAGTIKDAIDNLLARTIRPVSKPAKFRSAEGNQHVKCYHGNSDDGFLFPLRRGFLFVRRPCLFVGHDAVKHVSVGRSGLGRTFDLDVELLEGGSKAAIQFRMLENEELGPLKEYVSSCTWGPRAPKKAVPAPAVNLDGTGAGAGVEVIVIGDDDEPPAAGAASDSPSEDDGDNDEDEDFRPESADDGDGTDDGDATDNGDASSTGGDSEDDGSVDLVSDSFAEGSDLEDNALEPGSKRVRVR